MPTVLTCAAGHKWRSERWLFAVCPRCGGRPVSFTLTPEAFPLADLSTESPGSESVRFAARATAAPVVRAPEARPPSPPPAPAPPTVAAETVAGYELLGELGRGGMGVVYKARQRSLNRIVALKMMRRYGNGDDAELARFRVEAEAVARLDHPHIVRVHDFGEHEGRPYISMEFVDGGSLAAHLAAGPLAVVEAARLVETLARAMQHAHDRGVIHRDLKPANVLLSGEGRPAREEAEPFSPFAVPKIADFGLAKRLDEDLGLTVDQVMGTASYMAPEQAAGRSADMGPRTDLYALGAILYEALTGRPPFRGATREMTLLQVQCDEPVRPALLRPTLPDEMEAICLKCLEKEPERRYPNGLALAEDLRRFQAGEALTIRPLSEWEQQVRWGARAGFEILELIGCSVLGMVFKARQTSLNRVVALKTISPQASREPAMMARFRHEAEVAASLQHANIVQIYDYGEHAGQAFLALEHVGGGTLADWGGRLPVPPRQAATLVAALARAVHAIHQRGIVHSDLRPFNVHLTADGAPKITGFGLSQLQQETADPSAAGGRKTFSNYLAPEQTAGPADEVGPAADVHALGAILYELLTGQTPFAAETVAETLERIRREPPEPPRRLRSDLPRRLDAACLKCLEKEPDQRYPSAAALAEDLTRFLAGEQTLTDDFELIPGYELLEEISQDAVGVVYKARQLSLDRPVALHIVRADLQRVLAANRAVARLSHPYLVQIYDCGERENLLYIAEELVEGENLEAKIAAGPRPAAETARLIATLARTLHHVHEHGVVHRNVKPAVVRFTAGDDPKLGGFDLACLWPTRAGTAEPDGRIVGTPRYMAPEQAQGRNADVGPSADLYALGVVLYEMLTGRPPFVSEGMMDLLQEVLTKEPIPPGQLRPETPPWLEAVCLRCLQKDPAGRYATGRELAEALDPIR